MYRITLINKPFAEANRPSLGFKRWKSLLGKEAGMETKIHYFYQETSGTNVFETDAAQDPFGDSGDV